MSIADYIKTGINIWPNWINAILLRCNIFGPLAYGKAYNTFVANMEQANPVETLLNITNFAIQNVEYYRKRYNGIRINSLEEFQQKIGFIDKKEVMDHWEEFLVDNIDWGKCIVMTTGGTSGKPMKLVLPKNRYVHSLAFWHKELKTYGWNYDARAVIRNHKLPSGRDYMINPILKEFIFDAFRMDENYAKRVWTIMKKNRVRYIHAYPSGAYQFLKYCQKQNLDVSFVKLCILTSEGVTAEQRHFVEQELCIPIYSSYGHSEKLIMAGSTPNHATEYSIEEAYGYCELLNDENQIINDIGIAGELVGTTFTNRYFPLIRYKTGDYSEYTKNTHKERHIGTVQGHRDKSIIFRADGGYTSIAALNLHGEIYEHIDGLQYLQEKKGQLVVTIIPNKKFTSTDESYLYNHFRNAMGDGGIVEIRKVKNLIFQENGKFLPLITKICK